MLGRVSKFCNLVLIVPSLPFSWEWNGPMYLVVNIDLDECVT